MSESKKDTIVNIKNANIEKNICQPKKPSNSYIDFIKDNCKEEKSIIYWIFIVMVVLIPIGITSLYYGIKYISLFRKNDDGFVEILFILGISDILFGLFGVILYIGMILCCWCYEKFEDYTKSVYIRGTIGTALSHILIAVILITSIIGVVETKGEKMETIDSLPSITQIISIINLCLSGIYVIIWPISGIVSCCLFCFHDCGDCH